MNHEFVNNRISQLPIAMAGIVHAFIGNRSSLSMNVYTASPFAK
jgi:hypothetical protein